MKKAIVGLLLSISAFAVGGCWVAHTAHDRPELRANVGRKGVITEEAILFRDRGGRLHLAKAEMPTGSTLVDKLPARAAIEIKDVIYRISEPGRSDYFVMEVLAPSGRFVVEVPVGARNLPAWIYEN